MLSAPQGGWQIVAGADQDPVSMAASRGACQVLRVQRRGGAVQVEAWEGGRRCVLETRAAGQPVRAVVSEVRLYACAPA